MLAVRSAESHLYHPMTKLGARGRDTTCHSTADNPRSTQATIDQLLERRKHHEGEVLVAVENSGDVVCLVAGAEHLGIRLKLPFIAVRTGGARGITPASIITWRSDIRDWPFWT